MAYGGIPLYRVLVKYQCAGSTSSSTLTFGCTGREGVRTKRLSAKIKQKNRSIVRFHYQVDIYRPRDGTAEVTKNGPRGYKATGRRIAAAGDGAHDEKRRAPGGLEECQVPSLGSAPGD